MQRLIFEYSPAYIILCICAGLAYAFILYRAKHHWSKRMNRLLFASRTVVVSLIAFLLLGPILKLTINQIEKPSIVVLVDDSQSIREVIDSVQRQQMVKQINQLTSELRDQDFDVQIKSLSGAEENFTFRNTSSDLSGAIKNVLTESEGKNLSGIILISDGIYNSGISPVYTPLRQPVFTLGIGDTTQRIDAYVKNVAYNKIAYQGNRFPVRVEVLMNSLPDQLIQVSLLQKGKQVASQTQNSEKKNILYFDFQAEADEKGIQRIDVSVKPVGNETNTRNNYASIFVEVVEGKKKILLVAPAPHPDVKALRAVAEKNENYEFIIHIPGVMEAPAGALQPAAVDLAIFQQPFDDTGKTINLYNNMKRAGVPMLLMLGGKTNFKQLAINGLPLGFEASGQTDEVLPVMNDQFRNFVFNQNAPTVFASYPPVNVPFGKLGYPPQAQVMLWQRIGSVTTNRPLLLSWEEGAQKVGVLIGEGIWRWRLDEFDAQGNTQSFDEVFGKLIQYLSTRDDKRKFRCFPIQNEFTDAESVIFESQVFNDLYESVYGNKVQIEIRDDENQLRTFNYVLNPGNLRYRFGAMEEGVYRYRASTEVNGKREEVRGEFLVRQQSVEIQNLTADFNLLRRLSAQTGGRFYPISASSQLTDQLGRYEAKSIIRSEDSFNSIINLKWMFFIILGLLTAEWFTRKFLGSY
jgi:hypothetical protein